MRKIQYRPRRLKSYEQATSNSSTIAAGAFYDFSVDERFQPFDECVIVNEDRANDVIAFVNFSLQVPITRGNAVTIKRPIQDLKIKNDGSTTISANAVKVNLIKESKQQETIERLSTLGNIASGLMGVFKR